ncbi:putative lipid II flippase FtsW [Legionella pneumophila]|uniref:Probable peptidoglycan glycosyltransferase FtsW n=1 Tax=Legionella pneumophila subsp. pascullei TaxID=91890 RepID=A0AAX2J1J1_LEGPN|nr:putative lipid II flippase FtsW [Legionella pneumophila]AMP93554.1 cell division protein FtsW [Legionella pneumophila subsp. pascullei]AMP96472.1 cell division protein FtsW [Legionella pneumophila subsp. pascullei]SQG91503.1 cell division protein FtsW [Legionella pneumophila subsp. pascullei]VEH08049.1 cell division protein FtsW [Legionella pneumophila subsp. pascullei]HDU8260416.1 putative lipid II flippase FtsW [Legionella pneumophila]
MRPRHLNQRGKPVSRPISLYDKWLIGAVFGLLIIGLMMVASSSVMISTKYFHQPFHFLIRQACYLFVGLLLALIVVRTDSSFWEKISMPMMIACVFLLLIVLIPGIGKSVNGSRRWLAIGPIGVQVSELTKLAMIFYLSGYLVRQQEAVCESIFGFIKPMAILAVVSVLLLLEPDFGATVVISGTVMAMLFLAGVKLRYYFGLMLVVVTALALLAVSSPYRVARLTAFLDPWADQYNSGYQLTQSLIAFGRGGWFGTGLGESIQKLLYLPEAHTDFLFAVIAEELGLFGILVVITLYSILVVRGLNIGYTAYTQERYFASYTAYGLTIWLALQASINMGVNAGLLPTKGLTLPLLSYGGASMVINCIVIALLLRIDHENRWQSLGLRPLTA